MTDLPPLYIFDLDGTLSDATHRQHHVHGLPGSEQDWRAFFAACKDDKPISAVLAVLQGLRCSGADIYIWTGRGDEAYNDTIDWLGKFGAIYDQLVMRCTGDHRTDVALKRMWYETLLTPEDKERLVAVFEDRKSVVDMWRFIGVPCFQVAPGDF